MVWSWFGLGAALYPDSKVLRDLGWLLKIPAQAKVLDSQLLSYFIYCWVHKEQPRGVYLLRPSMSLRRNVSKITMSSVSVVILNFFFFDQQWQFLLVLKYKCELTPVIGTPHYQICWTCVSLHKHVIPVLPEGKDLSWQLSTERLPSVLSTPDAERANEDRQREAAETSVRPSRDVLQPVHSKSNWPHFTFYDYFNIILCIARYHFWCLKKGIKD